MHDLHVGLSAETKLHLPIWTLANQETYKLLTDLVFLTAMHITFSVSLAVLFTTLQAQPVFYLTEIQRLVHRNSFPIVHALTCYTMMTVLCACTYVIV